MLTLEQKLMILYDFHRWSGGWPFETHDANLRAYVNIRTHGGYSLHPDTLPFLFWAQDDGLTEPIETGDTVIIQDALRQSPVLLAGKALFSFEPDAVDEAVRLAGKLWYSRRLAPATAAIITSTMSRMGSNHLLVVHAGSLQPLGDDGMTIVDKKLTCTLYEPGLAHNCMLVEKA